MGAEQRKYHRFPVPGSRQEGELRFGDSRIAIRLLDQSANGFAAMAWQTPVAGIGCKAIMRAGDDWFEVCLKNVTQIDIPQCDEDPPPGDQVKCYRLGLYRLGDISNPDQKEEKWSWPVLRENLKNVMPANTTTFGFGLLFVCIVIGLPVLAILFFQHLKGGTGGDPGRFSKNIAYVDEQMKKDLDWENLSAGGSSEVAPVVSLEAGAAAVERLANYAEELNHIIHGKPGASVFIAPQIIQQLNITKEQQDKIRAIVDATSEAIDALKAHVDGAISPEQYQHLFDLARNNALQLLTDDQRRKWQNLSQGNGQNKSRAPANVDK
jgi:hypothetical protein